MRRRYFLAGFGSLGVCPLCTGRVAAADHEHWSYSGESGPERWGEIDKANAACSAGSQQSPLNISGSVKAMLPPIAVSWKKDGGRMVNNGHTIQVNVPPGSTLSRGGSRYRIATISFSPSQRASCRGHALRNGSPLRSP